MVEAAELRPRRHQVLHPPPRPRDGGDKGVSRKSNAATIARQANAAAGGPLMTPDEFNDEIGI